MTSTIVMEGNADVREYPGGYSDYVRQRKNRIDGPKAIKDQKSVQQKKQARAKTGASKKLSFNQQYALENLPKEIAKINQNIKMFEDKLSEPDLYSKDPELFNKCTSELEKLSSELSKKEEEWWELEILREEIG